MIGLSIASGRNNRNHAELEAKEENINWKPQKTEKETYLSVLLIHTFLNTMRNGEICS